ncbi:MAG: Na/Pi cotransporter family protein [Reyranellaceae bacterium]
MLWALRMVRTGIMRAYGAALRRSLGNALGNRFAALAAGLGVTLSLQSSTATTLMASSMASRKLVADTTVLAIILGADIGSSLVAQVLSFDLSWLSPVLILVGVVGFMSGQATRLQDVSRALIGVGLMLLALRLIGAVAGSIRASDTMHTVLLALGGEPFLAALVAAGLALLSSSSLAVVLLTMTLAAQGAIAPGLGVALVVGANLGGALLPFFAAGADPAARRGPLGNILFRGALGIAALLTLPWILPELALLDAAPARQVVNFHTAFNLALAIIFLPLLGPTAALLNKVMPDKPEPGDEGKPRYLDPNALETPSVAIASAARETMRQGDVIGSMLRKTLEVFRTDDRKLLREVERMDDTVDRLHEAIKLYVIRVSREQLDDADSRRTIDVLTFTTNLEHIGDIIDKNLMELAAKKIKHNLRFSDEGFAEIQRMHERLSDNLALALNVFMSGDVRMARQLLGEKIRFREMERGASESHMSRLASGRPETLATSSLHLDVIRDLKRINSHLTAVAYPILDAAGELSQTRLKTAEDRNGD